MNELNLGIAGHGRQHEHLENLMGVATIVGEMNEMAQERRDTRIAPSKRKSASPKKKAKRKIVQASKKKNR